MKELFTELFLPSKIMQQSFLAEFQAKPSVTLDDTNMSWLLKLNMTFG